MALTLFLTDAIFSLHAVNFTDVVPDTPLDQWLQFPARQLFPGYTITWTRFPYARLPSVVPLEGWTAALFLMASFILLFGFYMQAIRSLARHVSLKYILGSAAVFGVLCLFFQATTSQDIFSYIAYARMATLYHVNPLATSPQAIPHDLIYRYLYWTDQPSAYGPTWIMITAPLQWLTSFFGNANLLPMILLLRGLGIIAHLSSAFLIWQLSGILIDPDAVEARARRLQATLAFAWNPLLLLEAVVNAHNDTVILALVLLTLYLLSKVKVTQGRLLRIALAMFVFALAICVKINLIILLPGVVLFLYRRQPRSIALCITGIIVCIATIVLLYIPFWQNGAVLQLLQVNPSTHRNINSPYEFLARLFVSLSGQPFPKLRDNQGAWIEQVTHTISFIAFGLLYAGLYIRALINSRHLSSLYELVKWMALVWLLYCLVGSPWLWPWYLVTFFGLFALLEVRDLKDLRISYWLDLAKAARLFAFALLGLYCFGTWVLHTTPVPILYSFQWQFVRGLWLCLLPLLALRGSYPFWQRWRLSWSKIVKKNLPEMAVEKQEASVL
ncbi:MAG: hypothetical protein E6J34_11250 [Chloroflexi bacterium]|nr:MAG: hypothetical protein E6J34_11250 [Chloroflexota bacterium]